MATTAGAPGTCPRCGTTYGSAQEYCLECGLRLPRRLGAFAGVAEAWQQRGRYPGDWIWPVLAFLVLAAGGALVAILVTRDGGRTTLVATQSVQVSVPRPPPRRVTTALETTPTLARPPAATAPRSSAPTGALASWPERDGYTVVLESLPTGAGRAAALRAARRAQAAGLKQIGVLESSRYSSLHPGYYVVFSGIYGTSAAAAARLQQAQTAGFSNAYARPITR